MQFIVLGAGSTADNGSGFPGALIFQCVKMGNTNRNKNKKLEIAIMCIKENKLDAVTGCD